MGVVSVTRRGLHIIRHPILYRIHWLFRKYTMIPASAYVSNLVLANKAAAVPGAIVECGTWRGGMIAGMAKILGKHREYRLYDSFEGLPPVEPIDGSAARNWQADIDGAGYHDNCTASPADALEAMKLSAATNVSIVKGWFEKTLPAAAFPKGIAILRMDADWYTPTMQILHSLFPAVNIGGLILIDDYYTWEGCSKAVHDYLSAHKRPETIRNQAGVCFIEKKADGPHEASHSIL